MKPSDAVIAFYQRADERPFNPNDLANHFAPSFVDHNRPSAPAELSDSAVSVGLFAQLAAAFPNGKHDLILVEDLSNKRTMVYWHFTGTHTASFFGNEPSNKTVSIYGVDIFTVADDKFTEQWHVEELLQLQSQMSAT